ncbi:MAG: hypothetical protein DRQ14_04300 [Candidatus Latescibacterota bacterium]|nr:MAG: hypothetical protein DRQ08_08555 [Candidatus Latescibacterota bacterium]RKY73422.1 MAG: hypothetical protein DRQ14_04300 [Candidatus Latescibacterota bacterium]
MRILEVKEMWIHTHFITDCEKLPAEGMHRIESGIEPVLRKLGIVYGIHFREEPGERGIRIVLECIPFPEVLREIRKHLEEIVKDIPVRPRPTEVRIAKENALT